MRRNRWQMDRRTALKALGVSIALPMLDVMAPGVRQAFGATAKRNKFIGVFTPNGYIMPNCSNGDFTYGDFEGQPGLLKALADRGLRDNLMVVRGLCPEWPYEPRNARAVFRPDAPDEGDYHSHWEATACFLGGGRTIWPQSEGPQPCQARRTIDQFVAEKYNAASPIRSLHVGSMPKLRGGIAIHPAYMNCIAWAADDKPIDNVFVPQELFSKVFGSNPASQLTYDDFKKQRRRSVLDSVYGQIKSLDRRVSSEDRSVLGNFFQEIRALENAIAAIGQGPTCSGDAITIKPFTNQDYVYSNGYKRDDYVAYLQCMQKIVVKAMECGLTSAATIMYQPVFETVPIDGLMYTGYHDMAHDPNNEKRQRFRDANRVMVGLYGDLVADLKAKNLLNDTLVYFNSDMTDGTNHRALNLPVVVAGGGNDLKFGQEVGGEQDRRRLSDLLREFAGLYGVTGMNLGLGNRAPENKPTGIIV